MLNTPFIVAVIVRCTLMGDLLVINRFSALNGKHVPDKMKENSPMIDIYADERSNAKLGLVARLAEQERVMAYQRSQFEVFKTARKEEHEELHCLINDRRNLETKAIKCEQDEICRGERAIASESHKNKFTLKRDWPTFMHGLETAGEGWSWSV